ncbi:restriction endonuclease subunit S [Nodosilinea sp. FACHB-13]|uniref:restriction endonuclease subunit S n=1 Tax=Cyanophyceae TaxID=3028117 RepID=UPI0016883E50|nr:restriction endonuclease subunit S [Nodosilinea sp. FACHB-13]MBD2107453.1 restriction endonuclease subunit S [Nodosilinea sp. FACHB-13]
MREALQTYEEYKDSGLAWLGDIPKDWKLNFLVKVLSSLVDYRGRTPKKVGFDENGMLLVTAKNIKQGSIDYSLSEEFVDIDDVQSLLNRGKPEVGDVLFTTEAPLGEVANVDRTGFALAQRIIKFRGNEKALDNYFMKYWLMSSTFQYSLQRHATGSTAQGLKGSKVRLLNIVLPSLTEQKAIAHYLDTKIAQIDCKIDLLIQKSQRYQELKRTLINETVTRGLDKSASMKDSGIEWIGEIPEHWYIYRIKDFTYVKGRIGWQGLRSSDFLDTGDHYCVTGTDLINGLVNWSDCYFVSKARYEQDKYIQLNIGDLLITKDGTIGKTALVDVLPRKATLNSGLFVTRPLKGKYLNIFLYWVLNSSVFRNYIDLTKGGSTIQHLYQNVFDRFLYCCPPLTEQQEISNYLSQKTNHIDRMIENVNSKIEIQKELRKTLINDVVTGKIKVT